MSPEGDSGDGPAKVTLLLGGDTLAKIDAATIAGRFGSRGRTIDALCDAIWDSRANIEAFMKTVAAMSESSSTEEKETAMFSMVLISMLVFTRFNKFLDIPQVGSGPSAPRGLTSGPPGSPESPTAAAQRWT